MTSSLILASGSEIRARLLSSAGLICEVVTARVDEDAARAGLVAEAASPHDIADALAELKACKVAARNPDALVIGADQILDLNGHVFAKPHSADAARAQLRELRGKTHRLHSAAVIYRGAEPLWRHVGTVRMTMHDISDGYLDDYVARNWDSIRHSVGCYKLEEEGVRLFSRVDGDHFSILGLPLIDLLNWLRLRGEIAA